MSHKVVDLCSLLALAQCRHFAGTIFICLVTITYRISHGHTQTSTNTNSYIGKLILRLILQLSHTHVYTHTCTLYTPCSQSSVKSEDKADFNLIEAKTIHSNVPNGEDGNTNTDVQWECDSERDTHNRMPCSDVSIAAKLEQSITTVAENSDPPVEVIANLEQTALEDHCVDIEPTEVNETNTENTSLDGVWLNESLNKEIADMLLELREATVVESERDAVMFGANTQEDVVDYLWDEFDERCDLEQNSVR